jgi:hypothetical protein
LTEARSGGSPACFATGMKRLGTHAPQVGLFPARERLGDAELGRQIRSRDARISGDNPDPGLLSFYMSRRACLRAKTAAWHLDDPKLANPGKWHGRAGEYLGLAGKYAAVPGGREQLCWATRIRPWDARRTISTAALPATKSGDSLRFFHDLARGKAAALRVRAAR